ncbi:hypothetical protein RvY_10837 [Ramazzottius varieornatus]|uniref:Uncharacterized protein n=1 Tax=Ramazzottius varieornatus TaxID=947166 RepID=A0A1D1VII3_RAMVA|nr:hypothetical protein RvY_10837 [Ramazzottius varieornatus]
MADIQEVEIPILEEQGGNGRMEKLGARAVIRRGSLQDDTHHRNQVDLGITAS